MKKVIALFGLGLTEIGCSTLPKDDLRNPASHQSRGPSSSTALSKESHLSSGIICENGAMAPGAMDDNGAYHPEVAFDTAIARINADLSDPEPLVKVGDSLATVGVKGPVTVSQPVIYLVGEKERILWVCVTVETARPPVILHTPAPAGSSTTQPLSETR